MRYLIVLLLAGCATGTGVAPAGTGIFIINAKATALGGSAQDAEVQAYREATDF